MLIVGIKLMYSMKRGNIVTSLVPGREGGEKVAQEQGYIMTTAEDNGESLRC